MTHDTGPHASSMRSAESVSPTPPLDAAGNTGHAESIGQLQLQALQAATESGVPVLCLSDAEHAAPARPQRGFETRAEALDKLRLLRDAAQPLAAKLDVSCGQEHCWHAFNICCGAYCIPSLLIAAWHNEKRCLSCFCRLAVLGVA